MEYYVGIDGGGTKTAICATNIDNFKMLHVETRGSSWREFGAQNVVRNLKDTLYGLLPSPQSKVAGIAMGLPCYGESSDGDKQLELEISNIFPDIPVYLTNDVEVGWAGSLALEPGINVVAGTGSIAFGKDSNGNTARSGGWGEFISDEGSCYWVGREMMGIFSKQVDGRIARGPLYEIVRGEFNLNNDIEFIDHIYPGYLHSRKKVAKLQILAEKAALAGDESVKELYRQAVQELCLLATAVRKQLDFPESGWKASCSGGLFKTGDLILPLFRDTLAKDGGILHIPSCTPVEGAVLLAFDRFCPSGVSALKRAMKIPA